MTVAPSPSADTSSAVERARGSLWSASITAWATSLLLMLVTAFYAAHRYGGSVEQVLSSWDGQWYVRIARHGYPDHVPRVAGHAVQSVIGFFPAYPLSMRATHVVLPFSLPTVGILVSTACALPATHLFGRLVGAWWKPAAARRATYVFAFFPGALVLTMVYPEALMLIAAIGCLLLLKEERWVLAGAAGAVATFTRPNAIEVWFACAFACIVAIRSKRDWRSLAAPALAPLGIVGYLAFLWARTGEIGAWTTVEHDGWHVSNDFGQQYLHRIVDTLSGRSATADDIVLAISAVLTIVLLVWLLRMRPPGLLTVTAVAGTALLVSDIVGAVPRFVLGVFPLLVPPSVRLRGKAHVAWVVVSAAAMSLLLLRVYGNYVSGRGALLTP